MASRCVSFSSECLRSSDSARWSSRSETMPTSRVSSLAALLSAAFCAESSFAVSYFSCLESSSHWWVSACSIGLCLDSDSA